MTSNTNSIIICVPIITPEDQKPTHILSDLGKPTKRGIRKCPNCGTYNGTRGIMCKNKHCNNVFKDNSEKRKVNLEAIKLVTATSRKVYSVRVRDRGPDYRGFVQLPFASEVAEQNVSSQVALCFVDSCQKLFDISILKCHESEQKSTSSTCIHIESALKCCSTGLPLKFKPHLVNILNVKEQIKQKLWMLVTETQDPLVQRVSKSAMAVKCQVTPKHPLGYLHFVFYMTRGRDFYDKYSCSCHEITIRCDSVESRMKCIHYYMCIVALASEENLPSEFANFVNQEITVGNVQNLLDLNSQMPQNILPASCKLKRKRTPSSLKNRVIQKDDSWHFNEWLSSVTEKINQRLSFISNDGLESLSFHIPMKFFVLLKNKVSCDYSKIEVSSTSNKHTVYKYVWHIMDCAHVKHILDTSQVPLNVSYYSVFHDDLIKVTQITINQSSPFMIEWIPNISSRMEFGQLKLEFRIKCQINKCVRQN